MSELDGNAYEWAEFNLPPELAIGPRSLSPLARGVMARHHAATALEYGDRMTKPASTLLISAFLLRS